MSAKRFVLFCLTLSALTAYLLVSAPAPLPEETESGPRIGIEKLFALVEAENDVARALWTRRIVADGKKVGLKFDEHWRDHDIEAGPLPALFLRETARNLEKRPVRLSLYLGSDYPISKANQFEGVQLKSFLILKRTLEPQFFFSDDTRLYSAMFTDIAISDACIECHNKHENSPKNDWKLNDVMGATTWSYPKDAVSLKEALEILVALRQSIQEAYAVYLEKATAFASPPMIGDRWPRQGYLLPSVDEFMREFASRASAQTITALMDFLAPDASPEPKTGDAPETASSAAGRLSSGESDDHP